MTSRGQCQDNIAMMANCNLLLSRFMASLGLSESLMTTYAWLEEGVYWRRRCEALYPGADVAEHGDSWKRMCVELTVKSNMESFEPQKSDMGDLKELCESVGKIVKVRLHWHCYLDIRTH